MAGGSAMIDLLKKVLDLVLRWLDWRKSSERRRSVSAAKEAIVKGDREALNRWAEDRRRR